MNRAYLASMRTWRNVIIATLIVCAGNGLSSCAVNPVSGHNDCVMMSESQEIAVGRDAHPKIIEQYGQYDTPALQAYVQT